MKAALLSASAVMFSACAPSSGLHGTGSDTFWITKPATKASVADGTAKDEALGEANAECAKQDKQATLVNDTSTQTSLSLMFQCVS